MNKISIPFTGSHIRRDEIDTDESIPILMKISERLREKGYCYVEVLEGDYKGSIAKFTPEESYRNRDVISGCCSREGLMIVNYYWQGRLSWEKKKNNPSFTLSPKRCLFIDEYEGPTVFVRKDLKGIEGELLQKEIKDVNGNTLTVGDDVFYMNLRYGSGGRLCRGYIADFKAHARQGYVSVIIINHEDDEEKSELRHPEFQILKLNKGEDNV